MIFATFNMVVDFDVYRNTDFLIETSTSIYLDYTILFPTKTAGWNLLKTCSLFQITKQLRIYLLILCRRSRAQKLITNKKTFPRPHNVLKPNKCIQKQSTISALDLSLVGETVIKARSQPPARD